jgi:prepilin-type N-terminal cleavage/methylation domain-containing protein/prepilin-type processing-associated H-X9-DG protein
MQRRCARSRNSAIRGFTILELLVSIAIIGLLVALLLPAVQRSREAARRVECSSHLRQIGIAVNSYAEAHRQLPYSHFGGGILFAIMPYLEQGDEHERLQKLMQGDFNDLITMNQTAARLEIYLCPDDGLAVQPGASSFSVNRGAPGLEAFGQGNNGRALSWRDVFDGLSQTAFVSERRNAPPYVPPTPPDPEYGNWFLTQALPATITPADLIAFAEDCLRASQTTAPMTQAGNGTYYSVGSGYNHVGTPSGPFCSSMSLVISSPAMSNHPRGVNVLLADGAVRFVSDGIDRMVWLAVGSRNGGEPEAGAFSSK